MINHNDPAKCSFEPSAFRAQSGASECVCATHPHCLPAYGLFGHMAATVIPTRVDVQFAFVMTNFTWQLTEAKVTVAAVDEPQCGPTAENEKETQPLGLFSFSLEVSQNVQVHCSFTGS